MIVTMQKWFAISNLWIQDRQYLAVQLSQQCQTGSYKITLSGVPKYLPTSWTTSIAISISAVWTMRNTFGTMQWGCLWSLLNATSRQFIWYIPLGPQGAKSISNQEMIQCFTGWGRVRIATFSCLWKVFPHHWSGFPSSGMLNRLLNRFFPWSRRLQ